MSTLHSYSIVTELAGESSYAVLSPRATAGGFTIEGLQSRGDDLTVQVAGDLVDRAALLTALVAAGPTLMLDKMQTTITSGLSDVITVTDSRGAAASGNVIQLSWEGINYSSATQITLDAAGSGSVTFGPAPTGACTSQPIPVVFSYADSSATSVTLEIIYAF